MALTKVQCLKIHMANQSVARRINKSVKYSHSKNRPVMEIDREDEV